MNKKIINIFIFFFLSLSLSGCGGGVTWKSTDSNKTYPLNIIKSLAASATVTLKESGLKGRANISVKTPGFFRIEILGPFGRVVALIVSDNKRLSIYDGKDFVIYNIDDPERGLMFTPEEIVAFLTGSFNEKMNSEDYKIELNKQGFLTKVVKLNGESKGLMATMADHKEVSGTVLPFSLLLSFNKEELFINYKDVEINQELNNILFTHPNL